MRNICISPRIYQSHPITPMTSYHIHPSCPTFHVSLQHTTRRPPIHRSKSPYSDCNTSSFVLAPIKSAKSSGMRSLVSSHQIYDPYHIHPSCPTVHVSLQPTTRRRPIHRSTEITCLVPRRSADGMCIRLHFACVKADNSASTRVVRLRIAVKQISLQLSCSK